MRARLMDATVELLVEKGFSGTTTTLVSERAGVSRGAQLHHFPTKNDLVVAAVTHLTERRGEELGACGLAAARRQAAHPRGDPDAGGPLRRAGVHGCAGAVGGGSHRRDPPRGGRAARAAGGARDPQDDRPAAGRRRVAARRARADPGHPRPGPRARPGQHARRRLPTAPPDPRPVGRDARQDPGSRGPLRPHLNHTRRTREPVRRRPRRPHVRGRPAPRRGGRPRRCGAGTRRCLPRAGPSRPPWPTCCGPTRSPCSPPTPRLRRARRRGTRSSCRRSPTRPASSTGRPRAREAGPVDLLARWDAGRTTLAAALREVPDGHKMPWFGPPMSATSMATARFMETWAHALDVYDAPPKARRAARAHRPDQAGRPPRRPHPRLLLRPAGARGTGRGVPDRADGPER